MLTPHRAPNSVYAKCGLWGAPVGNDYKQCPICKIKTGGPFPSPHPPFPHCMHIVISLKHTRFTDSEKAIFIIVMQLKSGRSVKKSAIKHFDHDNITLAICRSKWQPITVWTGGVRIDPPRSSNWHWLGGSKNSWGEIGPWFQVEGVAPTSHFCTVS